MEPIWATFVFKKFFKNYSHFFLFWLQFESLKNVDFFDIYYCTMHWFLVVVAYRKNAKVRKNAKIVIYNSGFIYNLRS
jgi:hypothetical protein